jgi:hypothetical protein
MLPPLSRGNRQERARRPAARVVKAQARRREGVLCVALGNWTVELARHEPSEPWLVAKTPTISRMVRNQVTCAVVGQERSTCARMVLVDPSVASSYLKYAYPKLRH